MVRDWGRQKRSFSEVGCCVQTEGNRGFGFWEYFLEESRSSMEMAVEISQRRFSSLASGHFKHLWFTLH